VSEELIQTTVRVLRRVVGGAESGLVELADAERAADALYERARSLARLQDRNADLERHSLIAFYLDAGRQALRQIATRGTHSSLDAEQLTGLEAIIRLTGRPSFLVQGGYLAGLTRDSDWYEPLAGAEPAIRRVIPSVGRVNLPERGAPGYVGTAFLVANDLVMTNRHVAEPFARLNKQSQWTVSAPFHPTVDFVCEYLRPPLPVWSVTGVALMHPRLDLALLRIELTGDLPGESPQPIPLASASAAITPSRQLYTVGFPANDSQSNSKVVRKIFGEIFNVKRLAPGEILAGKGSDDSFSHDCTTLGGNSGSCVVDFGTHRVLGLQFGGAYRRENRALSLPALLADPELLNAGVRYE
jgi:glutamyl endopeptidase